MAWTDRHGRPEITMHPDIARGGMPYRLEAAPKTALSRRKNPASGPADAAEVSQPEHPPKSA